MYNYFISSMMDCLVGPRVRTSATVGPTVAFASHRKKRQIKHNIQPSPTSESIQLFLGIRHLLPVPIYLRLGPIINSLCVSITYDVYPD